MNSLLKILNWKSMYCKNVLLTMNPGWNCSTCRNVINSSNRGTSEAVRDDDDQNTIYEIIISLSKFCHNIFKYRKAFLDYLDDYSD